MLAIGSDTFTAGYSLTRLLLAGSSKQSAVLSGASAAQTGRIDPAAPVQRQTSTADPRRSRTVEREAPAHTPSPFGPAAVFEPSEDALRNLRAADSTSTEAEAGSPTDETALGQRPLTEEERKQVEQLKRRDAEVRRHESAHKAAAGAHATGGPTFEYQTGPDGKRYATGGEVQIDTSPIAGNPQATIAKMQQIRRAALAPANPSGQDRAVAAQAAQAEREARAELTQKRSENGGFVSRSTDGSPTERPGRFLDVVA